MNLKGGAFFGDRITKNPFFPACAEGIPIGLLSLMRKKLAITGVGGRVALFTVLLGLSPLGFSFGSSSLRAQGAPTASPSSAPANTATPPAGAMDAAPVVGAQGASPDPKAAQSPAAAIPQQPISRAASEMTAAMEGLKAEGKLTSNRAVSAAVRKVIDHNSTQHEIPAPTGAKVIAVHKHPGDLVMAGDKIVTLEFNGKQIPILAKQDGIMQTINVSKGGVIGNSRPRAAKHIPQQGSILLTLRNI